jgi:peptide/nickel transport system permease protein
VNFWNSFKKNKGALIGLFIILFFCTIGLAAPIIAPNPSKVGVGPRFVPPSWEFPMGTDNLGRDMFQGVISGARISLIVGFAAAGTSMIIGVVVGSISGYIGFNNGNSPWRQYMECSHCNSSVELAQSGKTD